MRVLIVNKYAFVMGGADRHCAMLSAGLRDRGHEVMWLSTRTDWNVERAGVFVPRPSGASLALRAIWNRPASGAMRAAIERFEPDIVHAHMVYPHLSVAPLVVARRHGIPVVHTLHTYELLSANYASDRGGWIDRTDPRFRERLLNTATYPVRRLVHPATVDEFIAVSEFVANVHARRGIAARVVPSAVATQNGVPPPAFDRRRGIVYVGRLVEEKGVRDVLDVARRLPELPVTLVGAGPLMPLVEEASSSMQNLNCTGWEQHESVQEHLRSARVLLMPSRCAETSGLAALEALACGTPVVAFPAGGLADVMRDSGGGRLVAEGGSALAAACEELHGDRAIWEAFSRRGLEAVAAHFSTERWLDGIEAVYESALAGGARASGRA
jgi:glycosyltransferase involved in cell wall biosynthesis